MTSLDELERLAGDAVQLPWEASPADVPYTCRAAFKDAITPQTMLALLAVVEAAKKVEQAADMYDMDAARRELRAALAALEAKPQELPGVRS